MDEFLDEMDDEQVDDLLQPEEGEDKAPQLYEHFRFVADRGQSLLRVDKFLVDRMFGATRNRIQSAADAGCIMANGKPVKSNYRVKPEDVVTIMMTRPPRTFEILPENIPIKIVYEDDDLLVVDKPAGLVVHPGHGNYTGTLVNALAWYLKDDLPTIPMILPWDSSIVSIKIHPACWLSPKSRKRKHTSVCNSSIRQPSGNIGPWCGGSCVKTKDG
mgnify:CR=1 FL=1